MPACLTAYFLNSLLSNILAWFKFIAILALYQIRCKIVNRAILSYFFPQRLLPINYEVLLNKLILNVLQQPVRPTLRNVMHNDRYCILNGHLISTYEPSVPFNNRAFRYGDSLFESIRVCNNN